MTREWDPAPALRDEGVRMSVVPVVPRAASLALAATRPRYWPVAWGPAAFGSLVATGSWSLPAAGVARTVAVLLVLGPLVWGSVCTINDLHDLPGDSRNPRKAATTLIARAVSRQELAASHTLFTSAALAVALLVGPVFAVGTVVVLALGWAYSAPPLRLKGRAGLDVAANALAVGVLAPLSGWSLTRPVPEYPPLLAALGIALAAALYLPTTVLDRGPDALAGDRTFAVRWGAAAAHCLGTLLWAAATGLWLLCLARGVLGTSGITHAQTVLVVLPLLAYLAVARRPSIGRLAIVCAVFCLPVLDFLVRQSLAR